MSAITGKDSSLSSYITDREPSFYGGRQQEYLELAEETMTQGLSCLKNHVSQGEDPLKIYPILVRSLQDARHTIAKRHKHVEAPLFGIRRDDPSRHQRDYTTVVTILYGQALIDYNQKYLEQLRPFLHKLPHDFYEFHTTSLKEEEIVMGKHYSFQVELLDIHEIEKRKLPICVSEEELNQALGTKSKTRHEIFRNYTFMSQLKSNAKDLYERIALGYVFNHMHMLFPSPTMKGRIDEAQVVCYEPKSIYVLTTLRLEIEPGKMVCLAKRITWMYQNGVDDPIDRMKEHSYTYIIHQDLFLIERTQAFCAQVFADILAWDRTQSLDVLKDRIALLRFVYGNSMPCSRGDGAIGDFLELILYRYHGFTDTKHNQNKLPCFELLSTLSLSEYLKNYRETITVA